MNCDYRGLISAEPAAEMTETPEMQESLFPARVSLAMAYIPYQRFENLYDNEKALSRGTLFEALDLPFVGGKRGNAR